MRDALASFCIVMATQRTFQMSSRYRRRWRPGPTHLPVLTFSEVVLARRRTGRILRETRPSPGETGSTRTHLLAAVPSNSPSSLCWLGLVSTGPSWSGWVTQGSGWASGLVPAGPASGCRFWSSVRRQVLVSGSSGVLMLVPAAEPVLVGGLQVGLWKSCCGTTVSQSVLGLALPILERRGREGGRAGGGGEGGGEGGQDVRVGEEKKKTSEERRCRDAGSKSRSGSDSDTSGCLGDANDASPNRRAAHANIC